MDNLYVQNHKLNKFFGFPFFFQDPNNDINSVGYTDEICNIMYTGSDDGVIKVIFIYLFFHIGNFNFGSLKKKQIWDRRCLSETRPEYVGHLIGHRDGITHIDSKNDGLHLISNSKDQSIKLWDIRIFSKGKTPTRYRRMVSDWDYRFDDVPKQCKC